MTAERETVTTDAQRHREEFGFLIVIEGMYSATRCESASGINQWDMCVKTQRPAA